MFDSFLLFIGHWADNFDFLFYLAFDDIGEKIQSGASRAVGDWGLTSCGTTRSRLAAVFCFMFIRIYCLLLLLSRMWNLGYIRHLFIYTQTTKVVAG